MLHNRPNPAHKVARRVTHPPLFESFAKHNSKRQLTTERFFRIENLVQVELTYGKNLDQIKLDHKLSQTEQKIVDALLSGAKIFTLDQLASVANINVFTVRVAILTLENKLHDLPRMYHLQLPYIGLSSSQLIRAIKESKAKSVQDLKSKNYGLYSVAADLKVLDHIYKRKSRISKTLKNLRKTLKKKLKEKSLRSLCKDLSDFEKAIIKRVVLLKNPETPSILAKEFNVKVHQVKACEERLSRKFSGKQKVGVESDKLRLFVFLLSNDDLTIIFALANERERAILEECAMSEKAADMQSLAKKFNQSRERLRQIQKDLVPKIKYWKRTGFWQETKERI